MVPQRLERTVMRRRVAKKPRIYDLFTARQQKRPATPCRGAKVFKLIWSDANGADFLLSRSAAFGILSWFFAERLIDFIMPGLIAGRLARRDKKHSNGLSHLPLPIERRIKPREPRITPGIDGRIISGWKVDEWKALRVISRPRQLDVNACDHPI